MAMMRISSVDLSWLILEELSDPRSRGARPPLAVIPDEKHGWRVIVAGRSQKFLNAVDERRLADLQRRLRLVYDLRP
jgi:hypothetical protein